MLQSMTGFGKANYEDDQQRIQVEIKSLNAKYADISLQIPRLFIDQTLTWRSLIITQLHRGKIELTVNYECKQQVNPPIIIQESLFKAYYSVLTRLANEAGVPAHKTFQIALKSPGVMVSATDKAAVDETAQKKIENTIQVALQQCDEARSKEGIVLAKSVRNYLQIISQELAHIEKLDGNRAETIRARFMEKLSTIPGGLPLDAARLEQELIYYLEKIDITEEKVRLLSHLAYFETVMQNEKAVGKKLAFIAQEIGRELNTLGAKANVAAIQQHVVIMKNELEKIKEQLQNIL